MRPETRHPIPVQSSPYHGRRGCTPGNQGASMNQDLTRREFGRDLLGGLLIFSTLETLLGRDLLAGEGKAITARWLADLQELGLSVQNQKLPQVEWQKKVEELFAKVDLPELLKFIDFDRLTKDLKFVDRGARSLSFKFPEVEGLPTKLVFGKQIFALKKERSVVPHGHNNMATAFLILNGDLRGRHYDRLEDHDDHIIIRPTIDRTFSPGGCSTISDKKDNVHWFQALSETAFIFNIHVYDVSPGLGAPTGRVYLNPEGEKLAGGLIRAPRLNYQQCERLFG